MLFYVVFLVLALATCPLLSAAMRTVIWACWADQNGDRLCLLRSGNALLPEQGQGYQKLALLLLALFIYAAIAHHYGPQYTYISAHNDYGGSGLKYRLSLPGDPERHACCRRRGEYAGQIWQDSQGCRFCLAGAEFIPHYGCPSVVFAVVVKSCNYNFYTRQKPCGY